MISYKYKFIFVHIPRTGGSSLERTLGQGITTDERTKYLGNTDFAEKHAGLAYYYKQYPAEFAEFFKFTIIRNPFDRLVSQWIWRTTMVKDLEGMSFKEFIISRPAKMKISDKLKIPEVSINDSINLLDYIGRFEDLHNTYDYVFKKINVPQLEILHINKTNHKVYREYYTPELVDIVMAKYEDDIKLFGYQF